MTNDEQRTTRLGQILHSTFVIRHSSFRGQVMAVEIKVPSVGESITEGVLARWLKKDGEFVRSGEPLFELETDKATQEVPAPADGVLSIGVKEGEPVAIGSVVGSVDPKAKPKPVKTDTPPASAKAAPRETVLSP